MITSIRGRVEDIGPGWADVDLGPVSVRAFLPIPDQASLSVGAEARLHTHLHVREEELSLYGFATPEQRRLFEALIEVGGIGPRLALAMLSVHAPDRLLAAIEGADIATLTRVPGVGKKVASRLILELRGKLVLGPSSARVESGPEHDAVEALIALGFNAADATRAVEAAAADEGTELEDLLERALQALSGGPAPVAGRSRSSGG